MDRDFLRRGQRRYDGGRSWCRRLLFLLDVQLDCHYAFFFFLPFFILLAFRGAVLLFLLRSGKQSTLLESLSGGAETHQNTNPGMHTERGSMRESLVTPGADVCVGAGGLVLVIHVVEEAVLAGVHGVAHLADERLLQHVHRAVREQTVAALERCIAAIAGEVAVAVDRVHKVQILPAHVAQAGLKGRGRVAGLHVHVPEDPCGIVVRDVVVLAFVAADDGEELRRTGHQTRRSVLLGLGVDARLLRGRGRLTRTLD